MMSAAYKGFALFAWYRYRTFFIVGACIYLALWLGGTALSPGQFQQVRDPALLLMRLAAFLLPGMLFTSSANPVNADIAGSESYFPKYLFTLPLTARQLVVPFMTYAALVSALLWAAGALVIGRPALVLDFMDLPVGFVPRALWLPLIQLSLLGWGTVLNWISTRRRWTRIVTAVLVLCLWAAATLIAANTHVSGDVVAALCLIQLPLAYTVAVWAVARARRGDPERTAWRKQERDTGRPVPREPFKSALRAQGWFEWRLNGKSPLLVGCALIFLMTSLSVLFGPESSLLGLLLSGQPVTAARPGALLGMLLMGGMLPALFPLTAGMAYSSFRRDINDPFLMPPFLATLPLSTGEFVWCKAKALTLSFTVFFILIFVIPATLSAMLGGMSDAMALLLSEHRALQIVALLGAVFIGVLVLALGCALNVMWVSLAGGRRTAAWTVSLPIGLLLFLGVLAKNPSWLPRFVAALPSLLPWLAAAKLGALALLIYRVDSMQLYARSRIRWICGCWAAVVTVGLGLYVGDASYLSVGTAHLTTALLALIVMTPILAIFGAPLALQRNRSR